MKNKSLRQHGKKYYGKTKEGGHWQYNKVKSARSLKKRCNCIDKGKAAIMKCGKITEPQREEIFNEFWKMSWHQKKVYVRTLIQCIKPKRPRNRAIENVSKRKKTLLYHLRVNNIVLRVCRTLFLNTLSIGRHNCLNWLDSPLDHHIIQEKQQPQTERVQDLHSFFDSIASTDSHYCRSSTTKKYLLPEWRSKRSLYDFYKKQWCHERETDPVSITTFNSVFTLKNLSLFLPKKDLCEICSRHNVQNYSNEEFLIHQEKKNEAREQKAKDKDEESYVFTVDLQTVLMAPKSNVSSFYYRTKLQVHNLVFYDLKTKDAYCFLWNEVDGGLTSEEFASVWVMFIETIFLPNLQESNDPVKIIFYSDGCTYQNRNSTMANALLNAAMSNNITIEQKILEVGHTQMEADSVHSVIERALKNRTINVPADYVSLCKGARKKPKPYYVTYLDYTCFKSFKNITYLKTIRPGRVIGDPKVTDIRALKYTPNGDIFYKLRFSNAWSNLPQRLDKQVAILKWCNLEQLYNEKRQISKRKYDDLQILKETLPKDYHSFYENLPHE